MQNNRIFTVPLILDDDVYTIDECIVEAERIRAALNVTAVQFRYSDGVTYTVCADGRTIQQITSTVYSVFRAPAKTSLSEVQ